MCVYLKLNVKNFIFHRNSIKSGFLLKFISLFILKGTQKKMSCCSKFAKNTIGLANLLILVACAIIMGVGYTKMGTDGGKEYYDLFKTSPAFMIFVMVLVFCFVACVIGFLLCCCENKCWRVLYAIVLTLVVVAEIAVIVVFFTCTDTVLGYIGDEWNSEDEGIQKAVKSAEENFCCCGFENATKSDTDRCSQYTGTYQENNCIENTCYAKLQTTVKDNLKTFGIGTIVVLVFELLLYVLTIYYACLSSKELEYQDITRFH